MNDGTVGRLLVASLHQAIADLMPSRLEFYESWLNPAGLRDGRIGLAPLAAVVSFLREDGDHYEGVVGRAGDYAGEWSVAAFPARRRALVQVLPARLRARMVRGAIRDLVRRTSTSSRAIVHRRQGQMVIEVRGSIFCAVRTPSAQPRCEFYRSAIQRVLPALRLAGEVEITQCRATGERQCLMQVRVREGTLTGGT